MKVLRAVPNDVEWERASHLCVCERCECEYWRHETVRVEGTWEDNPLCLHQLCDGRYVKL